MGWAGCPGHEPDCLKPAETRVSAHTYVANSLLDRDRRHAETGEEISIHIHMANSHGDRAKEGRRSERRHSANSLWERIDSCVSVGANIVVAGVVVSSVLRGSTDVSKGAKLDKFNTIKQQKLVGVTPHSTLGRYSKGFMPRVKRGGFVLHRVGLPRISPLTGLQPRAISGPGFCKASCGSRCRRWRQQVAAAASSSKQAWLAPAPHTYARH